MPKPAVGAIVRRNVGDARPEHPALAAARKQIAGETLLAGRFAESAKALTVADEGFVSEAWRKPSATDWSQMGAVLPHLASDVVHVGPARVDRWSMALEPVGHAEVAGVLDAGRVVYEEALHHTDLVATSGAHWVEQLYVLKDASAPTTIEWKLHLGRELTRDPHATTLGQIHFVDRQGYVALRIEPPFAVDATGKHVEATLAVTDDTLSISIDPTGLNYPIVVDPLLDVPFWAQIGGGGSNHGYYAYVQTAWSANLGAMVTFGGEYTTGAPLMLDAYQWAWTRLAPYPRTPASGTWNALGINGPVTGGRHYGAAADSNGNVAILGGGVGVVPDGTVNPPSASLTDGLIELTGTPAYSTICTNGVACSGVTITAGDDYRGVYMGPTLGTYFVGSDGNIYNYNPKSAGVKLTKTAFSAEFSGRHFFQMSGDMGTGDLIFHSGQDGTDLTPIDVAYRYSISTATLTRLCGPATSAQCPPVPRIGGMMAYDPTRKVSVLTGGFTGTFTGGDPSNAFLNDVWEFDDTKSTPDTQWTQILANG
ncbi:MAG: hypothetical protein ACHREM_30795, partial [Polyangiales bacterium]